MLTPPFHFSIVACPAVAQLQDDVAGPSQILYRGSVPATRNLPFLKRLKLKTVVYCRKKELKEDDVLVRWTTKRCIELKWVKAEGMGEEKLGMGKNEISDVLKVILDPTSYPLYLADLDGISHTTLIVACLRKLQGWHLDSIINEVTRFEPEYEDLPLIAFINAYLVPSSDTPFTLPPPPYPSWLWPAGPTTVPTNTNRSQSRERTSSSAGSTPSSILPFPHPLTARRHPTMKLSFPALPPAPAAPPSAQSPQLAARDPNVALSRVSSIRSPAIKPTDPEHPGLVGAATNLISNSLSRVASAVGGSDVPSKRLSRNVSFENEEAYLGSLATATNTITNPTSPERLSRQPTIVSSEEESEEEVDIPEEPKDEEEEDMEDDDEEDDDEEEDDDDDDEDDEDVQPPSQYISALDLAGF